MFEKSQASIQSFLDHGSVEYQEIGILALGAYSEQNGAYYAIEAHLDKLYPFLSQKLLSENKEIRATCCWTLSKYSEWIAERDFQAYHDKLVQMT